MPQRLAAGAGAGMTATALTHPIDTLRLRLALPGSARQGAVHRAIQKWAEQKRVRRRSSANGLSCCGAGMWACAGSIVRTEGPAAFYKGLMPALAGIAPYAAINFATYDGLKAWAYGAGRAPCSHAPHVVCLGSAGSTELDAHSLRESQQAWRCT